ncbi:hypothetical protein GWI33_019978 [Rhynchophorus ferrugineus]|uniref:Uncharacterized protein n=1 Tax=Rhynchophorus ferrugineus TaxID=354439 RepID=A0A834HTB3_RHYFE|nr:hypothetical protein GWI33_019978 [Rhynchophorus ferrugineus]
MDGVPASPARSVSTVGPNEGRPSLEGKARNLCRTVVFVAVFLSKLEGFFALDWTLAWPYFGGFCTLFLFGKRRASAVPISREISAAISGPLQRDRFRVRSRVSGAVNLSQPPSTPSPPPPPTIGRNGALSARPGGLSFLI